MSPRRAVGPVRAVLFDFDFTLGDSSEAIVECATCALVEMGFAPPAPPEVRRTIGLTLADSFRALTGQPDAALARDYTRLYVQRADVVMAGMTAVYPAVGDVLATLRRRGLGTAIVSTKYRYRIEAILAAAGLAGAVDLVVGGEDVEHHKPHPSGLERALAGLGTAAAAALYVGDHPVDGEAARRAGVPFVRVLSGEAFGPEHWAVADPVATIADVGAFLDVFDRLAGASSR